MVAAYVDSRQRGPAFVCVAAFVVLVVVVTSAVALATATLAAVGTSPENTAGGHDYDSPSTIAVATTPAVTDVASRGFPAATGTTGFTYDSPLYSYATNTAGVVDDVVPPGPYARPSGATTPAQRASVQGRPCVECGDIAPTQVADHINPLVREWYETGRIDLAQMRALDAVQPMCPTCSASQGGHLSWYSRLMKEMFGFD